MKIKDLKEVIKNLPDDMPVINLQEPCSGGYHVTNFFKCKTVWVAGEDYNEKDRLFKEDIESGEYKPIKCFIIGMSKE